MGCGAEVESSPCSTHQAHALGSVRSKLGTGSVSSLLGRVSSHVKSDPNMSGRHIFGRKSGSKGDAPLCGAGRFHLGRQLTLIRRGRGKIHASALEVKPLGKCREACDLTGSGDKTSLKYGEGCWSRSWGWSAEARRRARVPP